MAYVDLDKIINVTWWGGGWVYPDVPYPVLSQRIGIFNKPDAWDTDSNGWFGLLWNSVNGICGQNYNFNAQMAIAMDTGIGLLSTRVKSYDFSTDIYKIDSGILKRALFEPTYKDKCFDIDDATWEITAMEESLNTTTIITWSLPSQKWYIATSAWGNKFLIYQKELTWETPVTWTIASVPLDADNNIIAGTINTATKTLWSDPNLAVIAVKWQYIWCVCGTFNSWDPQWMIYTISDAWVMTEVAWSSASVITSRTTSGSKYFDTVGSYISWDNCYVLIKNWAWLNHRTSQARIDLSNTTIFTASDKYTNQVFDFSNVGFDGSNILYTNWSTLYSITSGWVITTLYTAIDNAGIIRFRNSAIVYQDEQSNFLVKSNWCTNYKTKSWLGGTYTHMILAYEMTGTNEESDITALVKIYSLYGASYAVDWLEFLVNWSTPTTIANSCLWKYCTMLLWNVVLATPSIELAISLTNTLWRDLKLWIGITWWTYATPTLPSNNGMATWSATTARTAGSDASYIDLTLST